MPDIIPIPAPMEGWKTKAGGIVKICTGVAAVLGAIAALITHYSSPDSPAGIGLDAAAGAIVLAAYAIGDGLTALGVGHKQDKQTAAVKENTALVAAAAVTPAPVTIVPVGSIAAKPVDPTVLLIEQFLQQVHDAAADPAKLAALQQKVKPV